MILGINKSDKLSQYDKSNLPRSINKKLAFISAYPSTIFPQNKIKALPSIQRAYKAHKVKRKKIDIQS